METPRKPLNKCWCSVPHYLSDIKNIYIKADRFPLMMLTGTYKVRNEIETKRNEINENETKSTK